MVLLLSDPLAVLLYAAANLALVLLGLVLVDLLADFLHDIIALLDGMRHPGALRLLEPVALGGILGPDLASVAVLLPELLTDLLLLIGALLLVLGLVVTLLPEIYKVMLVINTKKKIEDTFQLLQICWCKGMPILCTLTYAHCGTRPRILRRI